MYFRQHWLDPRLKFDGDDKNMLSPRHAQIWSPDTFLPNAKVVTFDDAMSQLGFDRISPDGEIVQSKR